MKRFLAKSLLLCGLSLMLFLCMIEAASIRKNGTKLAPEVFYAINKSRQSNEADTVYLGDSVSNQLWNQRTDESGICHLASNQAITVCGNYFLLLNYLEANPQTKTVYYIVRPQSLANDFWTNHTYQYFVVPFYDEINQEKVEPKSLELLYSKFGKLFVENKLIVRILANNNALLNRYLSSIQANDSEEQNRVSYVSAVYLKKMEEACQEHDVELKILAGPLADTEENRDWTRFEQDIKDFDLTEVMGEFLDGLTYYPEEWFSDGVHFTGKMIEEHGNEIRAAVLGH